MAVSTSLAVFFGAAAAGSGRVSSSRVFAVHSFSFSAGDSSRCLALSGTTASESVGRAVAAGSSDRLHPTSRLRPHARQASTLTSESFQPSRILCGGDDFIDRSFMNSNPCGPERAIIREVHNRVKLDFLTAKPEATYDGLANLAALLVRPIYAALR